MNAYKDGNKNANFGLEQLITLPTVRAEEFANWGPLLAEGGQCSKQEISPFASIQEYRFCKAVDQTGLKSSSTYSKLAGVSSKTAVAVRRKLVASGYIREHLVDSVRRGRSAILLEILTAGKDAIATYESRRNHSEL